MMKLFRRGKTIETAPAFDAEAAALEAIRKLDDPRRQAALGEARGQDESWAMARVKVAREAGLAAATVLRDEYGRIDDAAMDTMDRLLDPHHAAETRQRIKKALGRKRVLPSLDSTELGRVIDFSLQRGEFARPKRRGLFHR